MSIKHEYKNDIVTYVTKYIKTDQTFLHELLTELHKIDKAQKKAEKFGTAPAIPKIEFICHVICWMIVGILCTTIIANVLFRVWTYVRPYQPAECRLRDEKQELEMKEIQCAIDNLISQLNSILYRKKLLDERQTLKIEQLYSEQKKSDEHFCPPPQN